MCSVPSCVRIVDAPASVDAPTSVGPDQDTEAKLRALGPALRGDMLDVCTGLGYTSIAAARDARVTSVTTIELDPLMVRTARSTVHPGELSSRPDLSPNPIPNLGPGPGPELEAHPEQVRMQRDNPWSRELFSESKITR